MSHPLENSPTCYFSFNVKSISSQSNFAASSYPFINATKKPFYPQSLIKFWELSFNNRTHSVFPNFAASISAVLPWLSRWVCKWRFYFINDVSLFNTAVNIVFIIGVKLYFRKRIYLNLYYFHHILFNEK